MANGSNGIRTVTLVIAIVLALVTAATTTLAVSRGVENRSLETQLGKVVGAVEALKNYCIDLATVVSEQKLFSSSERALMDQRLRTVEKAVEEMRK